MFDDKYFMQQALNYAKKSLEENEIPIGAVIVCDNRIIAKGHNLTETLNDVTAHAEMLAITSAANTIGGKYLKECSLYVTLEPCPMCAAAAAWSQISRIVFGAFDNKKGFSKYSPQIKHPKTTIIGGIMEEECSELINMFFKTKR